MADLRIPQWKVNLLRKKRLKDQQLKDSASSNSEILNKQSTKISTRSVINARRDVIQRAQEFSSPSDRQSTKAVCGTDRHQIAGHFASNGPASGHKGNYDPLIARKEDFKLLQRNQSSENSFHTVVKEEMGDNVIYEHIIPRAVKKLWLQQESQEETDLHIYSRLRTSSVDSKLDQLDEKIHQEDYGDFLMSHDVRTMDDSKPLSSSQPRENKRIDDFVSEKQEFPAAAHTWGVKLRHVITRGEEGGSENTNRIDDRSVSDTNRSITIGPTTSFYTTKNSTKEKFETTKERTLTTSPQHWSLNHNSSKSNSARTNSKLANRSLTGTGLPTTEAKNDGKNVQVTRRSDKLNAGRSSWRWSMPTPAALNGDITTSLGHLSKENNSLNTSSTNNNSSVLVKDGKTSSALDLSKTSDDNIPFRSVRERRQSYESILDEKEPTKPRGSSMAPYLQAARLKFSNSEIQKPPGERLEHQLVPSEKTSNKSAKEETYHQPGKNTHSSLQQPILLSRQFDNKSDLVSSKNGDIPENNALINPKAPDVYDKGEAVVLDGSVTSAGLVKEAVKAKDTFKQQELEWIKSTTSNSNSGKSSDISQKNGEIKSVINFHDSVEVKPSDAATNEHVVKPISLAKEVDHKQSSENYSHQMKHISEDQTSNPRAEKVHEPNNINVSRNEQIDTNKDLKKAEAVHQEVNKPNSTATVQSSDNKPRRKGLFVIQTGDERDQELAKGSRKNTKEKSVGNGNESSILKSSKMNLSLDNIPVTKIDSEFSSSGTKDFFSSNERPGKVLSFASNSLIKSWEDGNEHTVPEIIFDGPVEELKSIMNSKNKLTTGKSPSKVSFQTESLATIHSYPSEDSLIAEYDELNGKQVRNYQSRTYHIGGITQNQDSSVPRITSEDKPTLGELNGRLKIATPDLPTYRKPMPKQEETLSKQEGNSTAINLRYVDEGDFFSESSSVQNGAILF